MFSATPARPFRVSTWLSIAQVASALCTTEEKAREQVISGPLRAYVINGELLVRSDDLARVGAV